MSTTQTVEVIEVDWQRIEQLVEHLRQADLSPEDRELIENILRAYVQLLSMIKDKKASIRRLRRLLFGARTEKLRNLVDQQLQDTDSEGDTDGAKADADADDAVPKQSAEGRRRGHGRHGADEYTGAQQVWVAHPDLQAGDHCPKCGDGVVYSWTPGVD